MYLPYSFTVVTINECSKLGVWSGTETNHELKSFVLNTVRKQTIVNMVTMRSLRKHPTNVTLQNLYLIFRKLQ
jgi:hypothetical protein